MPNGLETSSLTSPHTINSLGLSGGCEQFGNPCPKSTQREPKGISRNPGGETLLQTENKFHYFQDKSINVGGVRLIKNDGGIKERELIKIRTKKRMQGEKYVSL